LKVQASNYCEAIRVLFTPRLDTDNKLSIPLSSKAQQFIDSLNLGLDEQSRIIFYDWFLSKDVKERNSEVFLSQKYNMSISAYQKHKKEIEKLMIFQLKVMRVME